MKVGARFNNFLNTERNHNENVDIFTEELIQKAFERVCYKRRNYGCNNDIWDYVRRCYGINKKEGELSIPNCISKYIQRYLRWIKSIYEKTITVCPPETPEFVGIAIR